MMAHGRPGMILGLAVASVFVTLGWSGRLNAAWKAMRSGSSTQIGSEKGSNSGGLPPGSNAEPDAIERNEIAYVTVIRTGERKTVALLICPPQMERIKVDVVFGPENVTTEGTEQCVVPAQLMPAGDVPLYRAGQVVDR